jgi:hypothetical protein
MSMLMTQLVVLCHTRPVVCRALIPVIIQWSCGVKILCVSSFTLSPEALCSSAVYNIIFLISNGMFGCMWTVHAVQPQ